MSSLMCTLLFPNMNSHTNFFTSSLDIAFLCSLKLTLRQLVSYSFPFEEDSWYLFYILFCLKGTASISLFKPGQWYMPFKAMVSHIHHSVRSLLKHYAMSVHEIFKVTKDIAQSVTLTEQYKQWPEKKRTSTSSIAMCVTGVQSFPSPREKP